MLIDIEKQKEHFKNHVATFTDYGNIKILDFKEPGTSHYRIRFLFEEDYHRLHISGDLGELIAKNYNNMCYEQFSDFVHNTGYFEGKIDCMNRAIYTYDSDKAKEDLIKQLEWYDWSLDHPYTSMSSDECRDYDIDCILEDLNESTGLGSKAYDKLSEIDSECYEWIGDIGKEETGILELYMLAFELAQKQIFSHHNTFKCTDSFSVQGCDDDGFSTEEYTQIKKDSIWERDTSSFRMVGAPDSIRLENEQGEWIEITEDHLLDYFVPIKPLNDSGLEPQKQYSL